MINLSHGEVSPNAGNDEIDLIGLYRSVISTWKFVICGMLMVTIIFGAIKCVTIAAQVTGAVYSKPIRLTFPNASKLVFPSGAKFAYSDIVAPAVVQIAFERNKLSNFNLVVSDLQSALSVSPYAPTYPIVIEKYQKLMSDKKLTVDQLGEIQKQMDKEIEQITSGEALITLRLEKKELPKDIVEKVLNDIPTIWAERAMKEKGVLSINAQIASINSLNSDLILNASGVEVGDLLADKLSLLKRNITALSGYEGAQSVVDPKTGMRLMDLSFALDDFGTYVVGELVSPLRQLGLSKDIRSSIYFYEDRSNKLKITLAAQKSEMLAIKEALDSYQQYDRKVSDTSKDGNSVVPQLSSDMLDKLVSLSGDSAREKYKQQLNDKRLQVSKAVAETESRVADASIVLAALQKNYSSGTKGTLVDDQYMANIKSKLPGVISKLQEYFGVSERIYNQLSIESVGIRDQLYIPVTNTILAKKVYLDIKSTLLIWFALMFLTVVIVVPGCLIRKAMKERELAEQ